MTAEDWTALEEHPLVTIADNGSFVPDHNGERES